MKNVCVIGLGEIGTPLAELIEESKKYKVFRKDIQSIEIKEDMDIMHICIPYSDSFCKIVENYAKHYKPNLIIINSTVRPGTTDKIVKKTGIQTVHSPVRGRHPQIKEGLLKFVKFVGGETKAALEAKKHFEDLGITVVLMDSAKNTELAKLLETTYYAINIAAHRELYNICQHFGVDFSQAVTLYNATCTMDIGHKVPRPLMFPGKIGGHCLISNIEILEQDIKSQLLDFILKTNNEISKIEEERLKQRIKKIEEKYWKGIEQDFLKKVKKNAK